MLRRLHLDGPGAKAQPGGGIIKYRIGKYTLDVDLAATRAMYASMPDPDITNSRELNFLRFLSANRRVLPYFTGMGIDPRKAVPGFVSEADTRAQTATYCGSFPICGATDAPVVDLEWYEAGDDEAETTDFGFTLSILHADDEIGLYYEASLPWLLARPILPTRYENRYVYPDLADVQ